MTWKLKESRDLDDRWCGRVEHDPDPPGEFVNAWVELLAPIPQYDRLRLRPILFVTFQGAFGREAGAFRQRFTANANRDATAKVVDNGGSVSVTADREVLGRLFADYFDVELPHAAWESR